ncbi:MAG: hypothetical protein JO257_33180 [Deltaproteobacteria bacterium]|nr:hypothetical protein [Deltaproteobacteria bacterium]
MRAVLCLVLAGCFYAPNSYHGAIAPFPGKRVALGCLDVAVTLTDDARAPGPIVEYSFGNRCMHSTVVDFSSVHVVAYTDAGAATDVHPRDPRHELRPLGLDALWMGSERISYEGAPTGADVLCVDVGSLAHEPSQWVCLGARS